MKNLLSLILLLSLVFSQSKVTIDNEEIDMNQNEAIVEVLGMVCSMCAFGIEEDFQKKNLLINQNLVTESLLISMQNLYNWV